MNYRIAATVAGLLLVGAADGFFVPQTPCGQFYSSLSHRSSPKAFLLLATVSSNEDLKPGIASIDNANDQIMEHLNELRHSQNFRLFSVDILASCEYMPQELFECYSETCEIYPVDEEDVPIKIKNTDYDESDLEMDGWGRWDMPSNDYYDADEFPEGYTGYDGSMIWEYIHKKICFSGYGYDESHWKSDFNKAVSGLHSVVTAQVIRGIQEKIDDGEAFKDDEIWRDPKVEFGRRLGQGGETPQAVENLYFAYMIFLSAVAKVRDRLLSDCSSGMIDGQPAVALRAFLGNPVLSDPSIQVATKKLHDHALQSPDSLWEARQRSRELLRIMNCVQCNKCRLHGKLAMMGLSTALQIHLGKSGEGADINRISRVELAALLSTTYKFSKAVQYCKQMAT